MNQEMETVCQSEPSIRRASMMREFAHFLMREKKWWLIPLSTLVIIVLVLVLSVQSPSTPLLYPTQ